MTSNLEVSIKLKLQQDSVLQNIAQIASSVVGLRREFDRLSDAGRNMR
ncbi:hypothetical protein [Fontimonas thermophila]|nr:hypothetical protein [Fontimonas thermophila]